MYETEKEKKMEIIDAAGEVHLKKKKPPAQERTLSVFAAPSWSRRDKRKMI